MKEVRRESALSLVWRGVTSSQFASLPKGNLIDGLPIYAPAGVDRWTLTCVTEDRYHKGKKITPPQYTAGI